MDLSHKPELQWLATVLADVQHAAPTYEPLMVGAMARDLLLYYQHGVPVARATMDIDLAFAVGDWQEFDSLRQALCSSPSFTIGRPSQHRIHHREGLPVDLIPFGGIERSDGSIRWPEDDSVMGVLGYQEAQASAVTIILPGRATLKTVSLPMLAVCSRSLRGRNGMTARHAKMPATCF